ncbi:hypothetical protein GGI04_002431 [Coemansia thaxteri]|uniref:CBM21 domain-containing protein n=1 Tax=Coemansia thaxteri TaxID=2663907 RepID=A0A9W8BQ85_9FUNG|nr:hypothetical protein GGI04_002431 [Coemansia thaxteri]KAJ2008367.1 hypothetical protein H4R26_000223 [Coemansia thaxteri]KAJ2470020.1 hypothetical protein GGI02_003211 [Coemansia sp. RSA 2322]
MYIPASTSLFPSSRSSGADVGGRCSPLASVTAVEAAGRPHAGLTLRLQSAARKKTAAAAAAAAAPPAIVRNNSGEIVRPCLRRRAATEGAGVPRFVHFGADLECVRWFLKAQSPREASEDARPAERECGEDARLRLTAVRRPAPSYAVFEAAAVVLERVELDGLALRGTVKVHNVAFEKRVVVRYSFDQWRTAHEALAEFSRALAPPQAGRPGVDRFAFAVALPVAQLALPATVALCVRYAAAGREHWDNNAGANYLFRLAAPAAPAIADDDDDDVGLRAPRRLSFAAPESAAVSPPPAPSHADTRRYMEQSAARFGAAHMAGSNLAAHAPECLAPPAYDAPALPLFRDMAWCGEWASPYSSPSLSSFSSPYSSPAGVALPPARSASPMRTGSPIHLAVFGPASDAASSSPAVRAGSSPLAWSRSSAASALLC